MLGEPWIDRGIVLNVPMCFLGINSSLFRRLDASGVNTVKDQASIVHGGKFHDSSQEGLPKGRVFSRFVEQKQEIRELACRYAGQPESIAPSSRLRCIVSLVARQKHGRSACQFSDEAVCLIKDVMIQTL